MAIPLPEGSVAGIYSLQSGGAWGSAPLKQKKAALPLILAVPPFLF